MERRGWTEAFFITTTLPFVIESEAEGSAVSRTLLGSVVIHPSPILLRLFGVHALK
jgi:hypothetical protein